jgi:hypothetical protein
MIAKCGNLVIRYVHCIISINLAHFSVWLQTRSLDIPRPSHDRSDKHKMHYLIVSIDLSGPERLAVCTVRA